MLNNFFAECWNCSELPLNAVTETTYAAHHLNERVPDDFVFTPEYILQLIRGLDITKANGPDGVSAHILKGTASSISPSLEKFV